jgi:crotonobetainyl-CoA:carnitine CoA-transferase CaiB-like acyl-CoA transferase
MTAAVSKSLKDMTFEDFCRTVFDTTKRYEKPEVLKGVRAISTTQYILGPSCANYLAELGAETIKIELPKRGEPMRHTTPFNEPFLYPLSRWMPDKGTGLGFFGANANEYFMSLDFHKPEAIQIMKRLAAKSDVFCENYRAGTFDRWGIGYRQHAQVNPRVVYQWMGGFGGWGPGRNRASYDILGQAQGGCFSITGWHKEMGGMPSKQTIWIMDYWGGAISTFNIIACLYWRDNVSGKGNFLEYSQVHGAQRHLTDLIALYGRTGITAQRFGNYEPLLCVHGILKCGKSSYPNSKNPQEMEVGFCLVSAYKDEDLKSGRRTRRKSRSGRSARKPGSFPSRCGTPRRSPTRSTSTSAGHWRGSTIPRSAMSRRRCCRACSRRRRRGPAGSSSRSARTMSSSWPSCAVSLVRTSLNWSRKRSSNKGGNDAI